MIDELARLGLVDDADLELDKAALQLAALDHLEPNLPACLSLLDEMADRLRTQSAAARSPAEQGRCLARVLATEFGFEGDRETYDDPANADLIRVIERRRGLPVALTILYVAMARRMGWKAHALNAPGHVLLGLGPRPFWIIDPFHRGDPVRPEWIAGLFGSALRRTKDAVPTQVAPMTNRMVLVRLLMNQSTRAERAGHAPRALTLVRRITAVAPGYSFAWWERARLEQVMGDRAAARQSLSALLETTRDAHLRMQVISALDALAT